MIRHFFSLVCWTRCVVCRPWLLKHLQRVHVGDIFYTDTAFLTSCPRFFALSPQKPLNQPLIPLHPSSQTTYILQLMCMHATHIHVYANRLIPPRGKKALPKEPQHKHAYAQNSTPTLPQKRTYTHVIT